MAGIALAIGVSAVAGLAGAAMSANAAENAANTQAAAADRQAQIQKEMFEKQIELNEPFRQGGLSAQNRLLTYLGLPGGAATSPDYGMYNRDFSMRDFQADPGYGFRMSEGMKALERSAAARGLLQSGGTLKGVQKFGQELASSEYENAFSRYLTQREARMNPYEFLARQGQAAAVGQASNVGTTGANLAAIAGARGDVQAAQAMGTANMLGSALGSIGQGVGSYYANQPYLNYLQSITPATGGIGNMAYQE